ncbi:MAG: N-acetyltransferase [Alphaproteobacteria bacterium]|nr:N-acetyltransferase [Alphaproteobacteria bacterium]MBV9694508.1 N-acetyltransferase [Alphaproteobacteria bacterium]
MAAGWEIRPEEPGDAGAVLALDNDAFGPGRHAKSAYRLREGVQPVSELGFVAVENAELVGSVRFWPIAVGDASSLLLGPLAVKQGLRGRGIGIDLMRRGIERARVLGHASIILVGDEPYYARVGFAKLPRGSVRFPGPVDPARILGLGLQKEALENLRGDVRRARIDDPVCAAGAAVAPAKV